MPLNGSCVKYVTIHNHLKRQYFLGNYTGTKARCKVTELFQVSKGVKCMDKYETSVWIRCPICKGKTRTKVYEDTVLVRFPLFCPKCKEETLIDVVQLKMITSKEPDA